MMLYLLVKVSKVCIRIRQSEVDSLTDMVKEAKTVINISLHLLSLSDLFLCSSNRFNRSSLVSQHLCKFFLHLISEKIIPITLLVVIHFQAAVFLCHEAQKVQAASHSIPILLGIYQELELFVFCVGLYHTCFTLKAISP